MLSSLYPGSTLMAMFLLGVLWGLLLMAWSLSIPWATGRQSRALREEEATLDALQLFVEEVVERKLHETAGQNTLCEAQPDTDEALEEVHYALMG
jgi:hypothetical protein